MNKAVDALPGYDTDDVISIQECVYRLHTKYSGGAWLKILC